MNSQEILNQLPYSEPFLFVDEIISISAEGINGEYTFKGDAYFYAGHFKNNPVTPGVILTECMAQIGLVCFGIFLINEEQIERVNFALSNTEIDFYIPVFPEEKVKVISEKIYFRFNKLKCKVKMLNAKDEIVAKGTISGMIINNNQQ
ncbi:3-hydroxyacyl-ACP dehydratase FabZ family protein [Aequorivita lipolytica]|uniref:Beta-hydroxyacyl-ACP dehydratase n=1 Tax=Aequorivita lipolytica TaxID=153267 RepID=A0A5C6YM89_9FLAO|nr:beta-hydroxyacyl-ACP dehydratase [Aequorivita lipolytica]TXD68452.1 beta-hydroxyacyl-ACP dehydratase [Aequorivita lipolytica]SRX51401.1 3-hydroxyacyl-[acyl-carrier-protein] dehydratase FabZ [Aequorivita lipolytica]